MNDARSNIETVLGQVDAIDRYEGLLAYSRYRSMLQDFANAYGQPLNNTVAAFVSLSPNNSWWNNLRSLVSVLDGVRRGCTPDELTTSTYKACRDRAYNYLTGAADFMLQSKGPKIRAFFSNIMDPADYRPVTIDGHMMSILAGRQMTMVEAAKSKCNYARAARDFRRVARDNGLIANQLQAMLWFTWKRTHNIVYDGQLDLFRQDDAWGVLRKPSDVAPFTRHEIALVPSTIANKQLLLYNGNSQEHQCQ